MFKIFWVSKEEEDNTSEEFDLDVINSNEETNEENVWQVALDILESEDYVYIIAPIAWVIYEDIDLSINKTVLTIKWTREKPEEYNIEWIKIKNEECFWWKFIRNIILPENLDFDNIKATMENNLLIIHIKKFLQR
jgi:HSP20 family molecular chaperone IbpA